MAANANTNKYGLNVSEADAMPKLPRPKITAINGKMQHRLETIAAAPPPPIRTFSFLITDNSFIIASFSTSIVVSSGRVCYFINDRTFLRVRMRL